MHCRQRVSSELRSNNMVGPSPNSDIVQGSVGEQLLRSSVAPHEKLSFELHGTSRPFSEAVLSVILIFF